MATDLATGRTLTGGGVGLLGCERGRNWYALGGGGESLLFLGFPPSLPLSFYSFLPLCLCQWIVSPLLSHSLILFSIWNFL